MKSRFNVSLKRQPSHPLVVEIWKCWFDVLAAAFWNKKLRNSAEKSKLTALNNALKTQALTREGFACALAIYLWAALYFQKFISSIIEVSHPRNFQYTQLYNHVHALEQLHVPVFSRFWSPIWRRTSNTQGAYTVWEENNLSKITLKVAEERLTFRWKYLHSLCPVQLLRELVDLIESNSSTKKKILADGCSKE